MTDRREILDQYKEDYQSIVIPAGLDAAVQKGLDKGANLERKKSVGNRFIKIAASLLISLGVLTSAVNISPAFAEALMDIPYLGRLVEILQFVDGEATGGEITDGTDVGAIDVKENGETEEILIHFQQGETAQSLAAFYKIHHNDSPTVLQFDISGVRMFSAQEDFERIRALPSVRDVYRLMTLDDSMIRFNIVFEGPIEFEVQELAEPAALRLLVSTVEGIEEEEMFVVRTLSHPFGESFGHLEGQLFRVEDPVLSKDYRVLKDEGGEFVIEFASFESQEAAEEFLQTASEQVEMQLVIEQRMSNALPGLRH